MPFILSQFIEASRWLGALVVLAVHTSNLFINIADIMSAPHAPLVYVWWFYSAFELGHQAVLAFFVMSGYLVGGAVLAHLRKNQNFLREYFIHRVSRIYLVVGPPSCSRWSSIRSADGCSPAAASMTGRCSRAIFPRFCFL